MHHQSLQNFPSIGVSCGIENALPKLQAIFLYFISYNLFILDFFFNREGNHPDDYSRLTYRKLLEEVCRFANVLKEHGVRKGDRVSIYMPMVLELPVAMLACARIGAVHSIVVSGNSSTANWVMSQIKIYWNAK